MLLHDVFWPAAGRNTVMKAFRQWVRRNFRLHQLWAFSDCPAHFAKLPRSPDRPLRFPLTCAAVEN